MKIQIEENPDEAKINEVRQLLQEYNDPYWEVREKNTYRITLKENTEVLGGAVFTIFGEWLEVDYFCVHPDKRSKGLGTKLLAEAEKHAKAKGCKTAFLNTFNFQAKPFYEKKGYKVVYIQKNYPKHHIKMLWKRNCNG